MCCKATTWSYGWESTFVCIQGRVIIGADLSAADDLHVYNICVGDKNVNSVPGNWSL
ncbi:hypothetical protein DPMN_030102 [Dreissena polymorpha]|uniref:Uncharacterized protein n=1 Tax=Dreissena polymorpha TaxID=45954 RepID=A0A9D4LYF3_DREPO|nr:hypothetical protein DPMN_030102 [Dreissena polymorpha]